MRTKFSTPDHIGVAVLTLDACENFKGRGRQINSFCTCFALRQTQAVPFKIHVFPFQGQDFRTAAACKKKKPNSSHSTRKFYPEALFLGEHLPKVS